MSKNSTMNAKNDTKNEKKKGVNFFFILVEFVLCSFLIASISMKMILPAILSAFLAVFITSFPDIVLEKMGKEPMNRNIRFAVGAIGFVLLCYVVPDGKIAEVRQRQVDAAVAKQKLRCSRQSRRAVRRQKSNLFMNLYLSKNGRNI